MNNIVNIFNDSFIVSLIVNCNCFFFMLLQNGRQRKTTFRRRVRSCKRGQETKDVAGEEEVAGEEKNAQGCPETSLSAADRRSTIDDGRSKARRIRPSEVFQQATCQQRQKEVDQDGHGVLSGHHYPRISCF